MKYTTDSIITAVKRNASIPTSQKKFQTADFLAFMNEELQLTVVGEMLSLKEEYFVTSSTTSLAASTSSYSIPSAAVGWKFESVWYVDSNGEETKIPRISRSQRDMFSSLADSTVPRAFYFNGDKIQLVPDVGSTVTGSIRFDYVRIQNELVSVSSCGLISSVASSGTDYLLTVDSVPSTSNGVDIVSGSNPFGIIARESTATVAGSVITCAQSDFDRAPVAGDYVAAYGETCIPNIPEDYHPILAQAVTLRCLTNDPKMLQSQGMVFKNMVQRMRDRSTKRVSTSPRKILTASHILNRMR